MVATLLSESRLDAYEVELAVRADPRSARPRPTIAELMSTAGMPPYAWQLDAVAPHRRRTLLLASRQGGKSTVSAASALDLAFAGDDRTVVVAGPSFRQSKRLLRRVRAFYRRAHTKGLAMPKLVGDNAESLEFDNGSRVIAFPNNPETIRGETAHGVVVEEGSFCSQELLDTVTPMLGATDGPLIAISTAYAIDGWFFTGWHDPSEGWDTIKATADDCPHISREFLDREQRRMGETVYRREYFCEWQPPEGASWKQTDIDRAMVDMPVRWNRIGVGVDTAASESGDLVGIVAGAHIGDTVVIVEDASMNGLPPKWVPRLIDVVVRWRAQVIIVESNLVGAWFALTIKNSLDDARRAGRITWPVAIEPRNAKGSKWERAQPVASLSTGARPRLLWAKTAGLSLLFGEITTWDPNLSTRSPGRLDALVHLVGWLLGNLQPAASVAAAPGDKDWPDDLPTRISFAH